MPQKYFRRDGLPLFLRHTGPTTLPEAAPFEGDRASRGGPVTLCLHDAGLQSSVFEPLLDEIEEAGGRGLAFDMPGHGRSGSLDALPRIEDMAEMARWVADRCAFEEIVLMGHGMGALVAIEWARAEPERVVGLVLCGAGAALEIEPEAIEVMRRVTRGKAPRPFDPKRVCPDSGPDVMRRAYMEGIQTDPRATLVDLEACRAWCRASVDSTDGPVGNPSEPTSTGRATRIVIGEAEPSPLRARAERLGQDLLGASTARVSGAAHFLPLEQPAALAAEIRACGAATNGGTP